MALYTPFFEQSAAVVEQGRNRARINETAQRAYLGDQQALAELYGMAPDIAQSMEMTAIRGAEAQGRRMQNQTAAAREQRLMGEQTEEFQRRANEWYQERAEEMANIEDYEAAVAYAQDQLARAPEGYQELFDISTYTPEVHEQYKAAFKERDENIRQRDQRIEALTARLTDRVANPLELATGVVDGSIEVAVNQATGQVQLIDTVAALAGDARAVVEIPIAAFEEEEARPGPEEGQSLWELAPLVAGIGSAARAAGSTVTGQVPGDVLPVAEETIEARQSVNTAKNDLIRALSINPRFPVGEIQRLEREIDIAPRLFDSERGLRARMRSIDRSLRVREAQQRRAADDPSLAPEERSNARTAAENIANFLTNMGVPEKIDIEDVTVEYLEGTDRGGALEILETFTDEQLDSLPEDVQARLEELLRG